MKTGRAGGAPLGAAAAAGGLAPHACVVSTPPRPRPPRARPARRLCPLCWARFVLFPGCSSMAWLHGEAWAGQRGSTSPRSRLRIDASWRRARFFAQAPPALSLIRAVGVFNGRDNGCLVLFELLVSFRVLEIILLLMKHVLRHFLEKEFQRLFSPAVGSKRKFKQH